jgi:hypothetical protein
MDLHIIDAPSKEFPQVALDSAEDSIEVVGALGFLTSHFDRHMGIAINE